MNCGDIEFGTYDCTYSIMLPWPTKFLWEAESERCHRYVAVDKCLLPEILKLWEMGIKTTGCCCGHGKQKLAYIGVSPEYIPRMKELGYQVQFNSCRPDDEDSFVPKTELKYDSADKGFNRRDK